MKGSPDITSLRRDYVHSALRRQDLQADPIDQFHLWFDAATSCQDVVEPNAMMLSTTSLDLSITSRMVLLKGYDKKGFRFFTNTKSLKGRQMSENPRVALLFYWTALERQVHINGTTTLLPRIDTENYFHSRPRDSQLGAWASHQSDTLPDRKTLEERMEYFKKRFEGREVPLPDFWSGYLITPDSMQFWQGRSDRLHDRFRYTKKENGEWSIERLNP
ncbi:MAG: pyridoxamine 5'-phosphate oxidase [Verrucomicrobia bacterium RIFCSPHIGHO2_12_FULL_41_10]|nr:MAG: pyridoxamine 5'-phosphate oxidase [Verrucomicrobia bacterium RIFCSPHIGHO2_12_FULL_41_10]